MITFFTTAKPFVGHSEVIQRNALKSWTLMHPVAEVILFGDDGGAIAVEDLGIRHEPHTEKKRFGTNRMDYMFARAQAIARHDVLCYSNCDIIFMHDFRAAVARTLKVADKQFVMVGRRWDTEITMPCEFNHPDWQRHLRDLALQTSKQRTPDWIDYFLFSRGFFENLPPLVVGRVFWDNWTVWKALQMKKPVVDASNSSPSTKIMIIAIILRASTVYGTGRKLEPTSGLRRMESSPHYRRFE